MLRRFGLKLRLKTPLRECPFHLCRQVSLPEYHACHATRFGLKLFAVVDTRKGLDGGNNALEVSTPTARLKNTLLCQNPKDFREHVAIGSSAVWVPSNPQPPCRPPAADGCTHQDDLLCRPAAPFPPLSRVLSQRLHDIPATLCLCLCVCPLSCRWSPTR